MTGYANPDALVETDWLEGHLDDAGYRVIEVDEDTQAYDKGHIRGAVGWNWSTDLHAKVGRDYVSQQELGDLLSRAGVGADTTVILYGGNNNWFAAYAYWILKLRGFDNVRLLNGGRKKWELESRELTQDVVAQSATGVSIDGAERADIRALRDEVLGKLAASAFVDVRSPEEFRGEKLAPDHLPQEQAQVPGHIPGAANIPWVKAANDDGTFKSADELKELYDAEGVTGDKEVIAYCRIGERSSHTWFALTELLGYGNVKNYDGSWTEYGSLVGAPVREGVAAARRLVLAIGLAATALSLGACQEAERLGDQVREDIDGALEDASAALAEVDDAVAHATRDAFERVRSGVEELEGDLRDAAGLAGDEAAEAYEDLRRRAAELRDDAESAAGEASDEARAAWERVREALADLESRIREATDESGE